jgi:hypothetical protein
LPALKELRFRSLPTACIVNVFSDLEEYDLHCYPNLTRLEFCECELEELVDDEDWTENQFGDLLLEVLPPTISELRLCRNYIRTLQLIERDIAYERKLDNSLCKLKIHEKVFFEMDEEDSKKEKAALLALLDTFNGFICCVRRCVGQRAWSTTNKCDPIQTGSDPDW